MNWREVASSAIARGDIIPPEPPKPKEPKVITVKQLRSRVQPCFVEHKRRLTSHICSRAPCGKPAKWSPRLGRYIQFCDDCAQRNLEMATRGK